jgi:hypothetical protein
VSNLLEAIYSRRRESAGRAITIICNVRIVDAFAMARGKVKIRPRRQGAHIMSEQESTWLAWYMCAVSLMMTALGLLFLIASQSRTGAPVFDYWLLNTVIAVSFSPVGTITTPACLPATPLAGYFVQ